MKMKPNNQLNSSQALLSAEQVERLLAVLNAEFEVHGSGNFPTIQLRLRELIRGVMKRAREEGLNLRRVKLNGGAASHILASTAGLPFNDIDLIFDMDLSDAKVFDVIKSVVLDALLEFLPGDTRKEKISQAALKDAYVRKMVKVTECDLWSLISLNNDSGRFLELKFVDKMRRQFEFTVDSFQITLDPLVEDEARPGAKVMAESVFGDFHLALEHLEKGLVDTRQPEEIRGGGLLKYCSLLVQGYRPARPRQCRQLERYMCSRFFIDFPDVAQQQLKLRSYLDNHFREDDQAKYDYLLLLKEVIDRSTVCLMIRERQEILDLLNYMAYEAFYCRPSCARPPEKLQAKQTLVYVTTGRTYWIPVM